jgi:hypothetical protein
MKQIVFVFAVFVLTAISACNNAGEKKEPAPSSKEQADKLEKEVMDGHNVAMPKSEKIPKLQKETKRLIDSIGKLPAKAQEAAAPYKEKLEVLYKELGDAYVSMEKWMEEFDYDSAKDNLEQRVKYLADEKLRVDKVKEVVLESVRKADALLKEKF